MLFGGLALVGLAGFGFAASTSYWMMAGFAVVAGVGNGVFHPVDYTLLNRKVSAPRLGHAYSFHGITGSLGWALAPAMLVPLALAFSWRVALAAAGALAWGVLLVLCGTIFLEGVDVAMLNVALPAIRADLGVSTSVLSGVVTAYVLGYGGFTLLGGRAADLLGRRRMFLFWLTVFLVFSGLGGFAMAAAPAMSVTDQTGFAGVST